MKKVLITLLVIISISNNSWAKINEPQVQAKAQQWFDWTYKGLDEAMKTRLKNMIKNATHYWKFAKNKDEVMMFEVKQDFFKDFKQITADSKTKTAFDETGLIIPGKEERYSEISNEYIPIINLDDELKKAQIYFNVLQKE